ncbi:FAD/FMN-containing dehydrogenase [Paucidesulfovibrio gracilis DSM 16080]|uniref:FAD/FMN-containing dehydrogenase n=1 Tax=Paucidesulfovibrio gracilis DSM 16080 TaxID=1121449 RepID=A0A1T4W8K2_9BACT|nr:FAD-binding and (Fe-S)-binding domain-containing protein [Paucidesulfovibrio gracilis]SKA73368.1 FAD/FMN-containing dehydrogenase [Paucidesulfovibrio gracilis DSM 16080]
MPELGPHISIPDEDLLTKILGVTDLEQVAHWPEAVRQLAANLAAELFLVRYNPFVDSDQVKKSVSRRLDMSRPMLSGEYPKILEAAVQEFWNRYKADQRFREDVIQKLHTVLPKEAVGSSPHQLVASATDATDLRLELPMLVLFPSSEKEVQGIVRLAGEMGFSLIPRGGGTGLTGGAVPLHGRTAILSLSRMKRILDIDTENRLLCAQTGVITLDAIRAVAEHGLILTVDPASKAASSLGGNVAENAGGPFAFEYGTTIDNLFSYRMVTPTGEIIQVSRKDHPRHKIFEDGRAVFEIHDATGALLHTVSLRGDELRKPGLGKDVSNKFLGGLPGVQKEGVDGVITEACFVLYPKPAYSRTLCLEFYGRSMRNAVLVINDVVGLRNRIREQGDLVKVSALEHFDSKYVQAIEYANKSEQYEGDPISVILLQLDSDHKQALDEAVDTVVSLAQPYDGVDIFAARDDREAELFWEDRHKLSAIAKRTSGFKVNEDVVIPLQAIPDFSDFLENLNLQYLARAYRRALSKATTLHGVQYEDPRIVEAKQRVQGILNERITAADISDVEQEAQTRYLFQALREAYPKQDRALKDIFQNLLATRIVIANHMHAGDGNCHVNIPVNSNDADMLAEAHQAAEEVFGYVLKIGGEVSGEHGIGITKIAFQSREKIDALRHYKEQVDPKGVLNPGKLTRRELPGKPYTFSFNRLIQDLDQTALKDREHLTELLKNVQTCTRCGKCKQVCPMYYPQQGLEAHPRNKNIALGALIEAVYYSQLQLGQPAPELLAQLRELMEHCTACGKCTAVCPVKIDSAGAALSVRAFLDYKGMGGHAVKEKVLHYLAKDPAKRLPMAAKTFSLGQSLANRTIGLVPGIWRRRMTSPVLQGPGPALDFTSLAQELSLERRNVFKCEDAPTDRTVIYFPGCGGGLFSRSIGLATLYLLLRAKVNVVLPEQHLCCGYPLLAAGAAEAFKTNRHRTRQALIDTLITTGRAGLKATTLLTACGTCRESLESYDLSAELVDPLRHLDAMQYLHELGMEDLSPAPQSPLYHAACHAEWVGQVKNKAPEVYRSALAEMIGTKPDLSPGCCGESGTGAVTSPEIFNRVRHRKTQRLEQDLMQSDRERPVVVGCPSCRSGIKRSLLLMGRSNPVLHTVEYLALLAGGPRWKRELKTLLEQGSTKGRSLTVRP